MIAAKNITRSDPKGPTIGSKPDVVRGDNQDVKNVVTKKKIITKDPLPKRGGSARPLSNSKGTNGITMGASHGITSQVPPKDGPKPPKPKSVRGESPLVKNNNFVGSFKNENKVNSGLGSTKNS